VALASWTDDAVARPDHAEVDSNFDVHSTNTYWKPP